MWCSAAGTHHKLLDRVVCGASILTGGVFECDIANRRSLAVLCMLYKIRCNLLYNSQYRRTFNAFSVSLWKYLADPVFDGAGLAGFKSRAYALI